MSDNLNVNEVKDNVKNVDTWIRGLFIVVYGIIFYVLFWIVWLVVIFQFVMKVLSGRINDQLMSFSDSLTRYALQILLYVTFQSEERPWPIGPWPGAVPRAHAMTPAGSAVPPAPAPPGSAADVTDTPPPSPPPPPPD